MNLPESILLCLFPNGLVLSRSPGAGYGGGGEGGEDGSGEAEEEEEEVYIVDVSDEINFVGGKMADPLATLSELAV